MRVLKVLFATLIVAAIIAGAFYWLRKYKSQPPPTPTPFETKGKLQIFALDVGQGDGFLIISPGGKTVLIDAGSARAGDDVAATLQKRGVRTIDLAVATHPHADHIGGLRRIIGKLTVNSLLDSGQSFDSDEHDRLQRAVKARKVQFIPAKRNWKFPLDSGVQLEAFNPRGDGRWITDVREGGSIENANSVVLRLSYGNFAMIFTGDAETETEALLVKENFPLRAQVLKVGHHGSRHATSEKFLNFVKPETAIISCGADNRYGHPAQPTLDRLRRSNAQVFRTDLAGEISIISDGNSHQVSTARQMNLASLWQGRIEMGEQLIQPRKSATTAKLKKEEID